MCLASMLQTQIAARRSPFPQIVPQGGEIGKKRPSAPQREFAADSAREIEFCDQPDGEGAGEDEGGGSGGAREGE